MTWAMDRRLDWIDDVLFANGRINRQEICTAFGITLQVASVDLAAFREIDRHLVYDTTRKVYERQGGGSVRDSTPERRRAWCSMAAPMPKLAPGDENEREIANPRCGCSPETVRHVLVDHGTCSGGGCPYGGDF